MWVWVPFKAATNQNQPVWGLGETNCDTEKKLNPQAEHNFKAARNQAAFF
jgi:hypothetical protein